MSREQKVAVVEAYLDCFATKDLSKVSFAEDVTFEGPRMPKIDGACNYTRIPYANSPRGQGYSVKAAHRRGRLRCNRLRHGDC
jgi:hypothetical protein